MLTNKLYYPLSLALGSSLVKFDVSPWPFPSCNNLKSLPNASRILASSNSFFLRFFSILLNGVLLTSVNFFLFNHHE